MKKRLIASAVSAVMLFTTAFCGLTAPVHATDTNTDNMPEITEYETTFIRDPETGHISVEEDNIAAYSEPDSSGDTAPNTALPSSYGGFAYIKSTYPNVRNQNPYGTCWAHAATACAEFDMVKNHGMSRTTADFSELQLAYFNYHTGYVKAGLDGDQVYIPSHAPKGYLDVGGNFVYSMHTLAQWKCYTYESSLPYSNVVKNKNYAVNTGLNNYHNAAQLKNVRYLDIKNDPDSVKQAIMDYGAVYISYNHTSSYYSLSNGYSLYYNPNDVNTNHDVVIVGWLDNLSASTWPAGKRPPSNGAWLVRNSWTTDQSTATEYNYFYMSYNDASLANTAYAVDFEGYFSDDNIYQYDGSTTHATVYTNSVANVFTTTNNGATSQRLDSVMIPFTAANNVNYKIEVYTGLTSSDPRSGYLNSAATTTGWTTSRGIYTIDLNETVFLAPGEKFSIVVTALNGNTSFDIESSQNVTYYENGVNKAWFNTIAHADAGESFVYSNGSYLDAVNYNNSGNICIKALTTNTSIKKYTVSYVLNGGKNSTANPSGFTGGQYGTQALQNPTRSGYHFLGWYSDSSFRNRVTAINYNNRSNQTLYARWCSDSNSSVTQITQYANKNSDGSYQVVCSGCNKIKAKYTVPAIASIKLNYTKMAYTGSNRSPAPVIKTRDGNTLKNGTDYTYSYNTSTRKNTGRYYVTIKFKGAYNETAKKLYFTVVPKAPASGSAKLYGSNDIKVSWAKATGASGYYVYYKKSSAASYKNYKLTTARTLKFKDLAGNTKYNFKIIPYYKNGNTKYKSTKSKIVSATTLKKLNQPVMKKVAGGKVSLNWQSIKGASGYQVYWSAKKAGKYTKLCDYSSSYIGVTFSVGKNVTYWYKTRAYKKVDGKKIYGPWSTAKSYTLK